MTTVDRILREKDGVFDIRWYSGAADYADAQYSQTPEFTHLVDSSESTKPKNVLTACTIWLTKLIPICALCALALLVLSIVGVSSLFGFQTRSLMAALFVSPIFLLMFVFGLNMVFFGASRIYVSLRTQKVSRWTLVHLLTVLFSAGMAVVLAKAASAFFSALF